MRRSRTVLVCPLPQDLYGAGVESRLSELLAREHNVLINSYGTRRLRAVTHLQVLPEDVEEVVHGFTTVLARLREQKS